MGGASRMYGDTAVDDFSHIEGYEDHAVQILCFYDQQKRLITFVIENNILDLRYVVFDEQAKRFNVKSPKAGG